MGHLWVPLFWITPPWDVLRRRAAGRDSQIWDLRNFGVGEIWFTLQGTNISPQNGILKMIFLFLRWDMLISWRVFEYLFDIAFRWQILNPQLLRASNDFVMETTEPTISDARQTQIDMNLTCRFHLGLADIYRKRFFWDMLIDFRSDWVFKFVDSGETASLQYWKIGIDWVSDIQLNLASLRSTRRWFPCVKPLATWADDSNQPSDPGIITSGIFRSRIWYRHRHWYVRKKHPKKITGNLKMDPCSVENLRD